jgi:hypothetical protein
VLIFKCVGSKKKPTERASLLVLSEWEIPGIIRNVSNRLTDENNLGK